jgi:four helix bundle protein
MALKTYRELLVWQRAMELVTEIYKLTELLPTRERYGLVSQMRRSAVSIPSNIAEGFYRAHKPEQAQFTRIAFASGAELETQIEVCKNLKFITSHQSHKAEELLKEVMRMLNTISQKLRR